MEEKIITKQTWRESIRKVWTAFRRRMYTDSVSIELFGAKIELDRRIPRGTPYEVTVVLPRVEIRKKCDQDSCKNCQWEMILNSVTIAHSPREVGKSGKENPVEIPKNNNLLNKSQKNSSKSKDEVSIGKVENINIVHDKQINTTKSK